jgi:aminoglycoside 6'-N-acetyltransferase
LPPPRAALTSHPPVLDGERLRLRPLAEADLEPLAAIIKAPGVIEWWGPIGSDEKLRDDLILEEGEEESAFAIEVRGELAGWLSVTEENEPNYRSAGLDIMLGTAHQDQGLGPEALRLAIDWLAADRGHHRFTIDPDVANKRAIAAYEAVGFKTVGVMRDYEIGFDGDMHDGLLMDLLAHELN